MPAAAVTCPKCKVPLPGDLFNLPEPAGCPGCGELLEVRVYPALHRRMAPGRAAEAVLEESEASCFYHPEKKAVRPCEACGRFLCALCDCELGGQHLCPNCLDTGKQRGKITSLENHRTLHDSVALTLALAPLLIFYFTLITAPVALFLAIRHWKSPTSIVHRTKMRFVLAIIIASLEIAGWVVAFGFLATRHF
jgi:hypothetical protein